MYRIQKKQWNTLVSLIAVAAMLCPGPAVSQELPGATIRVNTRLVLVDVVVTDKQGHPINGLKAENFTVQEKGKTQKIAFLTTPQQAQPAQPPQLGPGIYSNKPEFRSPGGPITAILLDGANTPFKDQAYARSQMLKYVRDELKPGQRVGVFTLTNSLGVLQDFTSDPQILLAALQKFQPQEQRLQNATPLTSGVTSADGGLHGGGALEVGIVQAVAAAQNFENLQVAYQLERRVEVTLGAMRSLARILGGMPGRKEIIWLTAAFPFELIPQNRDVSEAELLADLPNVKQKGVDTLAAGSMAENSRESHVQEIRDVASQMANAQIAVYPVDVRGLASGMEFEKEDASSQMGATMASRAVVRMDDMTASQETMREMATETGGKAYVNQNEIKEGVALALADNAAAYTIGYYPEDKKWDGNYRAIKVKVDRDAEVRSRRGYFAIDPTQVKDKKSEQGVVEALHDAAPDTQVSFSAQVKPGDKGKVNVMFLVDPNTISADDASGGSKKINFVLYAAVLSPEGKILENRSLKVDQTFDAATYQKIMQQGGMLVPMDIDAQAGKNKLQLVVQDQKTGLVGSINAEMP